MNLQQRIRQFPIVIGLLFSFLCVSSLEGVSADYTTPFQTSAQVGEPTAIALDYIAASRTQYALSAADIADYVITDHYQSKHNGVTHIYLQQQHAGIPVANTQININIAADGSVINMGNSFVPQLARAITTDTATLSAAAAIAAAAQQLGLTISAPLQQISRDGDGILFSTGGISLEPIPVRPIYQPVGNVVRLAWAVTIYETTAQNWWDLRVDAQTGAILDRVNWVVHDDWSHLANTVESSTSAPATASTKANHTAQATNSYRVYPQPVESPIHNSPLPPSDGRVIVTNPAHPNASPFGWHDTDGLAGAEFTTTQGNNVHAYEDRNSSNSASNGSPDGGADLIFDFPLDLTQQPNTYIPAAVTNLFYWNNVIHDVMYQHGFDEASGSFQTNNYGNGGAGGDYVFAEAQDNANGSSRNNANFATPADGSNPRMQMFLWNTASPELDGDFDAGIISHEYGHGISNRLTGGPNNTGCLNSLTVLEQGGEGWSDFFGLVLTALPDDMGTDPRGVGNYALNNAPNAEGIRTYPYSTDMSVNLHTYNSIQSPLLSAPHGVGSVWAQMLWEMYWALTDAHGFDADLYDSDGTAGNQMALQLVLDGLKLQPCSPGFVDARDAILLADQVNYSGANQCLIWGAFAKRGLGESAIQGTSNLRNDNLEAYDIPATCETALTLTLEGSPSPVVEGETLTYTLTANNGTVNALTDVVLSAEIPADTTYISNSASDGGSESGGTVTFPAVSINSGARVVRTFQLSVDLLPGTLRFSDDMESGSDNWTTLNNGLPTVPPQWSLGTTNPHSGTSAWFTNNGTADSATDQTLAMSEPIVIAGETTLRFWHDYALEEGFDGGVVEISRDGGTTWADLGGAMVQNGYNGSVSGTGNPISGPAFTGSSGGYIETAVKLLSAQPESVQVRFRFASDAIFGEVGWFVDDVTFESAESLLFNTACIDAGGEPICANSATPVDPPPPPAPSISYSGVTNVALAPAAQITTELSIANGGSVDLNWTFSHAIPVTDALADGGLEDGTPNPIWSETSSNGKLICNAATCGTGGSSGAHSGDFWAWFASSDGSSDEQAILSQELLAPFGIHGATISFYLEMAVCDSSADFLELLVDGQRVYVVDGTSALCGQTGYTLQTVALPTFTGGMMHTIAFNGQAFANNGSGSSIFIDDIALSLDYICSDPNAISWLSLSSLSDTTAPISSTPVTLTFDATGLSADLYTDTLCITSDDPNNPLVEVPVQLTVTGTPTAVSTLSAETSRIPSTLLLILTVSVLTLLSWRRVRR